MGSNWHVHPATTAATGETVMEIRQPRKKQREEVEEKKETAQEEPKEQSGGE